MRLLSVLALAALTACTSSKDVAAPGPSPTPVSAREMGMDPNDRATPEERANRQTLFLTERLDLREDQIPAVREVALTYAERQSEVRSDAGGDRRATMQQMRALFTEQAAAYREIFDDAQDETFDELMEEVREKMREQRSGRGRGGRGPG